jgi:hypothetical protein
MPLFSRGRALAHSEHIPPTFESDEAEAHRDSGHAMARMLRAALSALQHPRFRNDEIAVPTIRRALRRADVHDVEL